MGKAITFITILMIINASPVVFAEEDSLSLNQLESKLSSIKNPFKSQLPEKPKEKKVVKKKPAPPERPKTPEVINPPIVKQMPSPEPMRPEITEKKEEEDLPPLPELTISGVIWDSDRPQAIINGHIINVGDAILQIEITGIHKTKIEGLFHGKPVTIKTQRSQI